MVTVSVGNRGDEYCYLYVDKAQVGQTGVQSGFGYDIFENMTAIVPNGSTYSFIIDANASLQAVLELK